MAEKEEEIKEAIEALEEISSDEEKERIAELRQKYIWDRESEISTAIEKGLKQGRKEGKREGIKTSIKSMTKKMLNEKVDIKLIQKITGLTNEEIEALKEENI